MSPNLVIISRDDRVAALSLELEVCGFGRTEAYARADFAAQLDHLILSGSPGAIAWRKRFAEKLPPSPPGEWREYSFPDL